MTNLPIILVNVGMQKCLGLELLTVELGRDLGVTTGEFYTKFYEFVGVGVLCSFYFEYFDQFVTYSLIVQIIADQHILEHPVVLPLPPKPLQMRLHKHHRIPHSLLFSSIHFPSSISLN